MANEQQRGGRPRLVLRPVAPLTGGGTDGAPAAGPPIEPDRRAERDPIATQRRVRRAVVGVALLNAIVLAAALVTTVSRGRDDDVATSTPPVSVAPASPASDAPAGGSSVSAAASRPSIAGRFTLQVSLSSFDQPPGDDLARPAATHTEVWVLSGDCDGYGSCLLQNDPSASVGGDGFALTPNGTGYDFRDDANLGSQVSPPDSAGDCAHITVTRTIHIDIATDKGSGAVSFSGSYATVAAPLSYGGCSTTSTGYFFSTT